MLLGFSDVLNMYTFAGTLEKVFMFMGFAATWVTAVYSAILIIKSIKIQDKRMTVLCALLEIYSLIYLIIILFTYIIPYCAVEI